MNIHELSAIAGKVLNLPFGESTGVITNGRWKFVVHRYRDGWYVLWDSEILDRYRGKLGRDIGRVFRDLQDFVDFFIMGNPSTQFVLEAQDISV